MKDRDEKLFARELRSINEDRIATFSDGVFAIAITLLVLNIHLPQDLRDDQINIRLLQLSDKFISYAISFFVIALYWFVHRRILNYVQRTNTIFLWLNMFFLFFVAFLPVPTNFIGMYSHNPTIIIVYTLTLVGCGLTSLLLWLYATYKHQLIDAKLENTYIQLGIIQSLIPSAIFLLSLLSLLFPEGAHYTLYFWLCIPPISRITEGLYKYRITKHVDENFSSRVLAKKSEHE